MEIWNHFPGYSQVRNKVLLQSLEDDLELIDNLFGRENLEYGAAAEEVKQEALRQLEIEWREERNTLAEFHVKVIKSQMKG